MKSIKKSALLLVLFIFFISACSPAVVNTPVETDIEEEAQAEETNVEEENEVEDVQEEAFVEEEETAAEKEEVTYVDGLDREVTISIPVETVISMAASNTELLYAVGAGEQIIARDDFSNYPEESLDLPSVGGDMSGYNMEEIVNLQPELVLAAGINSPETIAAIEELGITVYYIANPVDLEGLYETIEFIAEITGHTETGGALIADLQARVTNIEAAVATTETIPTVFYEIDATDPAAPYSVGPGTWHHTFIELAGGQNIATEDEPFYPTISQEDLIVRNPEFILLADALWGVTPEMVAERPGWDVISAVQNDQVFAFNGDLLDRPGPRLVDGLEALVLILHPELADQITD